MVAAIPHSEKVSLACGKSTPKKETKAMTKGVTPAVHFTEIAPVAASAVKTRKVHLSRVPRGDFQSLTAKYKDRLT